MPGELITQLKLKQHSIAAMISVLWLTRSCALSDTVLGNLIRFHNAVDPNVLGALLLTIDHKKTEAILELDETATLNVVAACDITRKVFASDAIDEIKRREGIEKLDDNSRDNIIDFANVVVNDLLRESFYSEQIKELLIKLEENIQL